MASAYDRYTQKVAVANETGEQTEKQESGRDGTKGEIDVEALFRPVQAFGALRVV